MRLSNSFLKIAKQKKFKEALRCFDNSMRQNGYQGFSCHSLRYWLCNNFTHKQQRTILIAYHKFAIGIGLASPYTLQNGAWLRDRVDRPPTWALIDAGITDKEFDKYVERTPKQEQMARKRLVKAFVAEFGGQ